MHQFVMDDLYDLLSGSNRFCDRLTGGLILNGFDKITRNRKRNVGLKQGDPHFAQRSFDVIVRQSALFGQPVKNAGQTFGEILKHA